MPAVSWHNNVLLDTQIFLTYCVQSPGFTPYLRKIIFSWLRLANTDVSMSPIVLAFRLNYPKLVVASLGSLHTSERLSLTG